MIIEIRNEEETIHLQNNRFQEDSATTNPGNLSTKTEGGSSLNIWPVVFIPCTIALIIAVMICWRRIKGNIDKNFELVPTSGIAKEGDHVPYSDDENEGIGSFTIS